MKRKLHEIKLLFGKKSLERFYEIKTREYTPLLNKKVLKIINKLFISLG